MSALGRRAQRQLYRAARAGARGVRVARRQLGLLGRTPHVQGLDGWRTGRDEVVVRARVLESLPEAALGEAPEAGGTRASRLWRRARLLHRRYGTVEVPGAEVEVRCHGASRRVRSDHEGYVVVRLPVPEVVQPTSALVGLPGRSARGTWSQVPIFEPGARARHLVVSDIDDTVLDTELTNPLRRFAQLLLADRPVRMPFDGVGALFQAFAHVEAPVFYVSNSPIALHHHLVTLFRAHGMPAGPLLLRGGASPPPTPVVDLADRERHKDRALRMVAADRPELPIVLLGDTSRHDSIHYLRLAERHPGRVAAIYIRRVRGALSLGIDEAALRARARRAGVPLLVVDSALEVAEDAVEQGFIAAEDVERVRRARRRDARQPEPLRALVET